MDGALSVAAWTAQRTGSARAGLRSRLQQGTALRRLPAAAVERRQERLSTDHLRALTTCDRRHPERAVTDEALLLEQAATLDAEAFRAVTAHWLERADSLASPDPVDELAGQAAEVSRLHLARTFDGWLRLDG